MHLEVRSRKMTACPDCRGERVVYTGEVHLYDAVIAVFWAFLYQHPGNPEVYIDVTFGTWEDDAASADHETFGSRTGFLDEHPHFASSLRTGADMAPDDPAYGRKLTRDDALKHRLLDDFWRVNDLILELPEVEKLFERPRRSNLPWKNWLPKGSRGRW